MSALAMKGNVLYYGQQYDPDGSVLLEMQGTEEQIDKVLALVNQGTYVNIDRIVAKQIPVEEREYGFHVR